jgi:hypothetical protein
LHDSLLADQISEETRSDNAVQFSKTTALLGAAGKISTTWDRRQPPGHPIRWLYLSRFFEPENRLPTKNKPPRFARAASGTAAMLFAYPRALTDSLVLSR